MITELVWALTKYALILLAIVLAYVAYYSIYLPLIFRKKYSKYSNVFLMKKFPPLLGDAAKYLEDINNGRAYNSHIKNLTKETQGYDLRAEVQGRDAMIAVISHEAVKETIAQIPHKIDRADINNKYWLLRGPLKVAYGSFINNPSTSKNKERRKSYFKILGLNQSSQHIPLIVENIKRISDEMKAKGEVLIVDEMNMCTNRVFMSILFGKDLKDFLVSDRYDYETPEGIESLDI